jgi:methionyl-tRNA synthetase
MDTSSYMSGAWAAPLLHIGPSLLLLLVLWSTFWKGLALWHSGRRGQEWWFIILLILNTVGILEIFYLFFIAKLKFSELFSKKI